MHIYKVFIHNTLGMEYYSTPEPRSNHLAPGFRWAPDFSRPVADPWNRLDRGHTTPKPHPSISVILPLPRLRRHRRLLADLRRQ
jgi:hypothetical protein